MGAWDLYENRVSAHGETKRDSAKIRLERNTNLHIKDSLSYFSVTIDGVTRYVSIINSDNLNEITMLSMPGEDFDCGGLVECMGNRWLITEKDANNEIYTRVKLIQCNHILRWIDSEKVLHEQWCVVEDGTKYLTGELEDRNFVTARGDSRIAITIARNEYTVKLNRTYRFLVDDPDSPKKLAYTLSKPLKVGKTYNGKGVFSFVLQEVVSTENDNMELGIADFYKEDSALATSEYQVILCKKIDSNPASEEQEDEYPTVDSDGRRNWL